MAITQEFYTGNGSQTIYTFPFPVISTSDVRVTIDGVLTNLYDFPTQSSIEFDEAPADGAAIRIFRQSDDENIEATFATGSPVKSKDLNDNAKQALYLLQELGEQKISSDGTVSFFGDVDLGGNNIINLGTPVNPYDGVNKAYVDSFFPIQPGGVNKTIQYNDEGEFNGDPNLTWDEATKSLSISGGGGEFSTTIEPICPTANRLIQFPDDDGVVLVGAVTTDKIDFALTGDAPYFFCRAWGKMGNGKTTPTLDAGGNIASVAKTSTGNYSVTFTTALASNEYCVLLTCGTDKDNVAVEGTRTTTGFTFKTSDTSDNSLQNTTSVFFAVFQ